MMASYKSMIFLSTGVNPRNPQYFTSYWAALTLQSLIDLSQVHTITLTYDGTTGNISGVLFGIYAGV